jgi:hypothetical protein
MKVIHLDEATSSFQKIFKEVHGLKQKVVFWQVFQGHRTICEPLLISYNHQFRSLNLLPGDSEIISSHPLFFYFEDQQVIFKSTVESRNATNIVVKWPPEIHLLDEADEIPVLKNRVQTFWSSKSTAGTERINDLVPRWIGLSDTIRINFRKAWRSL